MKKGIIKKKLQKIFKKISYGFFFKIYGKITKSIKCENDSRIKVKKVNLDNGLEYKVYKIQDSRLYTDRIHDTAVIIDNQIIDEPSFQFRNVNYTKFKNIKAIEWSICNSKIEDNIVFTNGTPRMLKNIDGVVLSLLTGGAGNNNYWHWLLDVLPRIGLCDKTFGINNIDYFLVPDNARKFQRETMSCLDISAHKLLSSKKYRHIKAKELIVTDHPVVTTGNATDDINDIPLWISKWLREKFIDKKIPEGKKIINKTYIERDREDSKKVPVRSISNEEEVKSYLLNKGFISVRLGEINFSEQVNLFHNSKCIVGLHGAAFANLSFCKPGTKVIELKSSTAGLAIENFAKKNNLDYNSVSVEANYIYKYDVPTAQGHLQIPINNLDKILNNK